MKATEMTTAQRQAALRQAQGVIDAIEPVLDRGDIDETQFKQACAMYSRAVIIRAQLTSMEGTKS